MKIVKNIILGFVISFYCINANGQDNLIKDDLLKLNLHYSTLNSYSMSFEVQYINDDSKVFFKQKGKVVHSPSIHYSDVAGNITLVNGIEFISIIKDRQMMYYNKNKDQVKKQMENIDITKRIDSLYAKNDLYKYSYLTTGKGKKRIFIENRNEKKTYDAFEIIIDSKTNRLLEFKYYIKSNSQNNLNEIRIIYLQENTKANLKLPFLKLKYYVKGSDKQKRVSENFTSYRLIDQTKK